MTVALNANASTIHLLGWVIRSDRLLRSAIVLTSYTTDICLELYAVRVSRAGKAHMKALALTDYRRLELLTVACRMEGHAARREQRRSGLKRLVHSQAD